MKSFMSVLATIVGIYISITLLMYLFQDKLLFMPRSEMVQTPGSAGMSAEDFWVETVDGVRIHGWFFPREDAEYVIVLSHGNAGNISYRLDIARTLLQSGAAVLMYDYRGYGKSEGTPSEKGLYRDINAVIDGLVNQLGFSERQIIMYGRSLGGAVAAKAASERDLGGLVLDSAFEDLRAMVRDAYPFVPSWLAKYELPTCTYIQHEREYPIMIMHSPEDEIIGVHHGIALYNQIGEPKRFIELTGGHNDNFYQSREEIESSWRWYLGELPKRDAE